MNNALKEIKYLKKLFKKDDYHIFFIINPIVEIIIFLWIKTFDIPENNIILLNLRGNSSGIINFPITYFNKTILDRLLFKFGYDRYSRKYRNFIQKKSIKYFLYSSWVHPEFYYLLENKNCLGHFYFEEGQLSHRRHEFIKNNKLHINNIKNKIKYAEELDAFHTSDAIKYVSIDPNAFSHIDIEKRIILNNFDEIKKIYKPYLIGKKFIGIGPAPRRLEKRKLINSLIILANNMPDNSIIKLHPGYKFNKSKLSYFKKVILEKTNKNVRFCNQKIFLELEMIFEKKFLFGDKSSLIRYSSLFDSEYKIIELY